MGEPKPDAGLWMRQDKSVRTYSVDSEGSLGRDSRRALTGSVMDFGQLLKIGWIGILKGNILVQAWQMKAYANSIQSVILMQNEQKWSSQLLSGENANVNHQGRNP